MRDTEESVVRSYWFVDEIEQAVAKVEAEGEYDVSVSTQALAVSDIPSLGPSANG